MSNNKSSSLGRGLGSLIPQKNENDEIDEAIKEKIRSASKDNSSVNSSQDGEFLRAPIRSISMNPMQPRTRFSAASLQELEDSIRRHGILQPLVVTKKDDGTFELIMGERRWRAAKRARLTEVPVIIRSADEQEKLELALIENIVRENLNPIELALGYKRLIEEFELTHEELAQRLNQNRSGITNTMRLLQLPDKIQESLKEGLISDAHAKIIVGLETPEQQLDLFHRVVERGLTVSRTRIETQKMGGTKKVRMKIEPKDEEMMKQLRQYLGTRAVIQRSGYRGKIIIEFFNYDELVDLVEKILSEE